MNLSNYFLVFLLFILVNCDAPVDDTTFKVDNKGLQALLVEKNGALILEEYPSGRTAEDLCNVQSVTKSIISILIGIAIDQEFIKDDTETIGDLLPELMAAIPDGKKHQITIKDILNQKTGLAWKGYLEHENWLNSTQPNLYVLNKPLSAQPNTTYNYNSGATHLLSLVLEKQTGKSTLAFAKEYLFAPLGITRINWEKRKDGYYDTAGFGLRMQPSDLLKIGQLVLHKGRFNDVQIVSEQWINKLIDPNLKASTRWGIRKSTHGYCWYHAMVDGEEVIYAMGYGGQFIMILPVQELIIVSTFNHDTPDGIDQQVEFLRKNLGNIMRRTAT